METMMKHIALIERVDQLIRLEGTGNTDAFAARLDISKTKLYRAIEVMKALQAPIVYDFARQTYRYKEAVRFDFGFKT